MTFRLSSSIVPCVALLLFVVAAAGQEQTGPIETLTRRSLAFFDHLADPTVTTASAFADLLAASPLAAQPQTVESLVAEYGKLPERYGRYLEVKLVSSRQVADDLVFLTFLYKAELFPVVWRIAYYRPPIKSGERPDWYVVRISFDTRLEQLERELSASRPAP